MSSDGASSATAIFVPTPKASIGAPCSTSSRILYSSKPLEAKIFDLTQPRVVKQFSRLPGQLPQVAGVKTHRLDVKGIAQSASQLDYLFYSVERVVRVHQQRCRRIETSKRLERREFIVVSLNVAVRHRAESGNAVHAAGNHERAAQRESYALPRTAFQNCIQVRAITRARLGLRRTGAGEHQYELNPPASEGAVAALEEKYGANLPQDYRCFVTQFADGGAGPVYGLFTIDEAFAEHLVPRLPFP
jgi:hypothetical protein